MYKCKHDYYTYYASVLCEHCTFLGADHYIRGKLLGL